MVAEQKQMEANMIEQGIDSAEMNVIRETSDEAKREARRLAKKLKTAENTPGTQTPNLRPFSPSMLSSRQRVAGPATPSMLSSQPSQEQLSPPLSVAQTGGTASSSNNPRGQPGGSTAQATGVVSNPPVPNVQSFGPTAQ